MQSKQIRNSFDDDDSTIGTMMRVHIQNKNMLKEEMNAMKSKLKDMFVGDWRNLNHTTTIASATIPDHERNELRNLNQAIPDHESRELGKQSRYTLAAADAKFAALRHGTDVSSVGRNLNSNTKDIDTQSAVHRIDLVQHQQIQKELWSQKEKHQTYINKLIGERRVQKEEIQRLKMLNAALRTEKSELKSQLKSTQAIGEGLVRSMKVVTAANEECLRKLGNMHVDVERKKGEISQQMKWIQKDAKEQIADLSKTNNRLSSELDIAQSRLFAAQTDPTQDIELTALSTDNSKLREERIVQWDDIKQLKMDIRALDINKSLLDDERALSMRLSKKNSDESDSDYQKRIQYTQKVIAKKRKEALQQMQSILDASNNSNPNPLDAVRTHSNETMEHKEILKEQTEILSNHFSNLNEIERKWEQMSGMQDIQKVNEKLSSGLQPNERQKEKTWELQEKLDDLQKRYDEEKVEWSRATSELTSLQKSYDTLKAQFDEERVAWIKTENELMKKQEETKNEIQDHTEKNNQLAEHLKRIQQAYDDLLNKYVNEEGKGHGNVNANFNGLALQNERMKKEMTMRNEELEQSQKECNDLRNKHTELFMELEKAHKEANMLKDHSSKLLAARELLCESESKKSEMQREVERLQKKCQSQSERVSTTAHILQTFTNVMHETNPVRRHQESKNGTVNRHDRRSQSTPSSPSSIKSHLSLLKSGKLRECNKVLGKRLRQLSSELIK